jgi:hypothetical protein
MFYSTSPSLFGPLVSYGEKRFVNEAHFNVLFFGRNLMETLIIMIKLKLEIRQLAKVVSMAS